MQNTRTFTFRQCFQPAGTIKRRVAVIGENQATFQMAQVLLRNPGVTAVSLLHSIDIMRGVGLDRTSRDTFIQLLDAKSVQFVGFRNIVEEEVNARAFLLAWEQRASVAATKQERVT